MPWSVKHPSTTNVAIGLSSDSCPPFPAATQLCALPVAALPGGGGPCLDVVVEVELVGVRAQRDRVHLLIPLEGEPGLDHVLGEHVALEQELVVGLQRVEGLAERSRCRAHVLCLLRR